MEIHTHGAFFLLLPLDIMASASRKYAMRCGPLSWGTLPPLDRILQVRDPGPGQ